MEIAKPYTDDPYSVVNPELARVAHTHLELKVDFNRKVLEGIASLTIERKPSTSKIILDNLGLAISRVTNVCDGTCLDYHVKKDHCLRSPLYVQLPSPTDTNNYSICHIEIEYETSPSSPALHWLTPAQTADSRHPFLLSNNKLTYARSWFPCQDTPSVKFTYSAKISVSKNFRVLMSASLEKKGERPEIAVYRFRQMNPVPSYAVIIAVGALERRKFYSRLSIFAERRFIDESFDMFRLLVTNMMENILRIAKSMCGPYYWDRYDICVLPPSIAHFEIECPCVIFISPTLIYGDFSCISSLARNISQSWAGNLVTCSNYEHLWLNKSFSIFISRRIICKFLMDENVESYLRREGLNNMNNMIKQSTINSRSPKCLIPNLTDFSLKPHEAANYMPFENGCTLLYHLEYILGGSSKFEPFLKSYFKKFAFKSINTEDWRNYLYKYFSKKKKRLNNVRWYNEYFYNYVSPSKAPKLTLSEIISYNLVEDWVDWNCKTHSIPFDLICKEHLSIAETIMFLTDLEFLRSRTYLTTEKLRLILHHFNYVFEIHNSEIRFLWLLLCIKVRWAEKVKSALKFATEFCSSNYACPIFQHLYEWAEMRPTAIETYFSNKKKMLRKTRKQLNEILHLNS